MKEPTKHMLRLFKVTQEEVDEDEPDEELWMKASTFNIVN